MNEEVENIKNKIRGFLDKQGLEYQSQFFVLLSITEDLKDEIFAEDEDEDIYEDDEDDFADDFEMENVADAEENEEDFGGEPEKSEGLDEPKRVEPKIENVKPSKPLVKKVNVEKKGHALKLKKLLNKKQEK